MDDQINDQYLDKYLITNRAPKQVLLTIYSVVENKYRVVLKDQAIPLLNLTPQLITKCEKINDNDEQYYQIDFYTFGLAMINFIFDDVNPIANTFTRSNFSDDLIEFEIEIEPDFKIKSDHSNDVAVNEFHNLEDIYDITLKRHFLKTPTIIVDDILECHCSAA